jgi:hypothetical protein
MMLAVATPVRYFPPRAHGECVLIDSLKLLTEHARAAIAD